jgi:hypothetical protein
MTFYLSVKDFDDHEEIVFENNVFSEVIHFVMEEYGRGQDFSVLWGDEAAGGPALEVAYHDGRSGRKIYIVEPEDVPMRWRPGSEGGEGMRPVLAPEQIPTDLPNVMTAVRGLRYPAILQTYDHFVDLSYGNDVTDSVGLLIGEDAYVIFIEPARVLGRSPEGRDGEAKRFTIYKTANEKGEDEDINWQADDEVFATDSPDELVAKLSDLDRAAEISPIERRMKLLDMEKTGKVTYVEPEITPTGQRAALLELNGKRKRNPSRSEEVDKAVDKYEAFHRFGPKKMVELGQLVIPRRVRTLGPAKYVLYRSDKVDPSTLRKPSKPVDYIHEHDAGVIAHATDGKPDTDVPPQFAKAKALVHLGQCLGFGLKDGTDAEATDPLPTLAATPDGHCLLVIQGGKKVLAMIWGGNLRVEPRGIDG